MGIPSSNSTDFSIDVSNVPSERVVTSTPSENTKIIPPDMSDTDINSGRMRDKKKLRFVFVFVYFSFARAPSASAEHSKFEESSSRQLPTDSRLGCFFARAPSASAEHSKFEESSSRQLPTDSRLGCLSGVFLEHFGRRAIFIEDPPTPTFVLYGQEVEARMSLLLVPHQRQQNILSSRSRALGSCRLTLDLDACATHAVVFFFFYNKFFRKSHHRI
ncbi:hypothetical protein NDU88_004535 [Pleurodeles waltl]|uniref:Uncharacterized protein n=1 Tax=Pleurodeles waltl TaxID=8319 RepID=A0AAV7W8J1_PLEWA|nr:hypothetical protein NDU88_004535 [Pleurodeles waltl]